MIFWSKKRLNSWTLSALSLILTLRAYIRFPRRDSNSYTLPAWKRLRASGVAFEQRPFAFKGSVYLSLRRISALFHHFGNFAD
jgi:hypothetical protein